MLVYIQEAAASDCHVYVYLFESTSRPLDFQIVFKDFF